MNAAPVSYDWINPVTIIPDRYGGAYSGAPWLADLVRRLEAIEPAHKYPAASELSGEMWTWELRWPAGEVTIADRCWRGENRGPRR